MSVDALRVFAGERYIDARDILSRLVTAGHVHSTGSHVNRRWFIDAADALIWDEQRPRTDREKRAVARASSAAQKEEKRLARLAQLAEPRVRYVWTDEQIEILKQVYPTEGSVAAAEKTGQPASAVRSKVWQLGIKCIKRPARKRLDGTPSRREKRLLRQQGKAGKELVAKALQGTAVVTVKKPRGPADQPGEPTYHPNFKFTRCPAPPPALHTNTYSYL